jgi:hypothetical protein
MSDRVGAVFTLLALGALAAGGYLLAFLLVADDLRSALSGPGSPA